MISPDIFVRKEMVDHYLETFYQYVLEEIKVNGVKSRHEFVDSALSEIKLHGKELSNRKLTILPVIDIDYEGKISTI